MRRVDIVVTAAIAAVALAGLAVAVTLPIDIPVALVGGFALLQALPLLWRRRFPVSVLIATTAIVTAQSLLHIPNVGTEFAPLAAAYAVGAYVAGVRAVAVTVVAAAALTTVQALPTVATGAPSPSWIPSVVASVTLFGASFLAGRVVRARRDIALARMRAALADERSRIARELHDVIAHHVGVMVVQAGAGRRVVADHPDQARAAFEQIERSGREALTAMPAILGALRADATTTPQPSVSDLTRLFADAAAAGLSPRLAVDGEPRPLPLAVDVSAYRIVEEALTNAAKHAGPATVDVQVRYLRSALEVVVEDDGRGGDGHDHGFGLVGMRERVELLGGHLSAGPRSGSGFAVRATLPTTEGQA